VRPDFSASNDRGELIQTQRERPDAACS